MEFEDQHQRRVEEEEEDEEDEEEGSDEMMMMNNNRNGSSSNRVKMVEALSQVQIQPTATMVAPPLISTKPRYRDCMRNHAINVMGYAVDGCCEFMPAGAEGSPEALKCAACGCHRNFHRMEEMGKPTLLYSNHVPFSSYHRAPALHLGQPRQLALPLPPPGGAGAGRSPSRGEDGDVSTDPNGGAMVVIGSGSGLKKRFRTKFSPEQKAAMLAMAERLGWRMQKCDEELVQQFCHETAVKRQVFKVWMHNNKHSLGKTNDSSTSNTSRRLQHQQQPEN